MSLNKPPKDKIKEKEIQEIIDKGGKVPEEIENGKKFEKVKWAMISVRMPEKMLKKIDIEIEKRIGLSRNAWILEAFQEKLKEYK